MIKRVVSFALAQPLFTILLTVLFIAGGIFAFKQLPIEAFPDVSDVQVTVISLFPGHAAEEIEKQVTIPIETELAGLPHSVRMFSHTQFGLSFIILTFNDSANDYFARQQVLERLKGVDLPRGVEPQLAPLTTPIGEIYRYRLQSDDLDARELRSIQDWTVERQLKTVPGVADVVSFGGSIKQYQVGVDLGKLKSYNLTLQDVFTALGKSNSNAGGSYIEQGSQIYLIRGIGKVLVDTPSGARVPLEQLSTINVRGGLANIAREMGSRLAAIGVFIHGRDMGSVVTDAQRAVEDRVKLPPGYFMSWGGEFENQQRAMSRLKVIVPISVFLIFLLLFDAFKSVKQAVLILLNVPFAVIGGIFALLATGIPLSVSASVGFIALFGQAVLNGVVMVSYFNQLRERGLLVGDAVREGALTRLRTVLMTALLAALGLLPAALSTGIGSETQKPLAVVIIGGLVSATVLTLFVLPALYLMFSRTRERPGLEREPYAKESEITEFSVA